MTYRFSLPQPGAAGKSLDLGEFLRTSLTFAGTRELYGHSSLHQTLGPMSESYYLALEWSSLWATATKPPSRWNLGGT